MSIVCTKWVKKTSMFFYSFSFLNTLMCNVYIIKTRDTFNINDTEYIVHVPVMQVKRLLLYLNR